MNFIVYLITYLAIFVFLAAVLKRVLDYIRNPIHVRWELYPVAHDKRASYGGSYLEDVDWWEKPRESSKIGELKVMIPEILLLKAVWENNRSLWFVTYPFHLGLYFTVAFIGLIGLGAVGQLLGIPVGHESPLLSPVAAATNLFGPAGFILTIIGAIGLFFKRLTDEGLKKYSTPEHFFNLGLFIFTMGLSVLNWLFVDPNFEVTRTFVANLIIFNFETTDSVIFHVMIFFTMFTIAYIPLTHMSHFFMKYFLYHDIRWGDKPNIDSPETDQKISVVLNYPVTWAAPHIAGHGKETWAEVATFNPMAEPNTRKE